MNKKVNELIPKALEVITQSGMAQRGEVDKEYKGYIASMGASIIQSGLIATLAFYSNESSDSKVKRRYLLDAVRRLIAPNNEVKLLRYVLTKVKPEGSTELNLTELNKLEKEISNSLIALKLGIRTFKQKE